MEEQVIKLNGLKLPSLNEYVALCRSGNHQKVSAKVREIEKEIYFLIMQNKNRHPIKSPAEISFYWHEKDKRRDKDNVAFGKKFILDALQLSGILPGDDNRWINGLSDRWVYYEGQGVVLKIVEEREEGKNGGVSDKKEK